MNDLVINTNEVLNVEKDSGMRNLFWIALSFLDYVFQKVNDTWEVKHLFKTLKKI